LLIGFPYGLLLIFFLQSPLPLFLFLKFLLSGQVHLLSLLQFLGCGLLLSSYFRRALASNRPFVSFALRLLH
jgi:ABC-type transport system involved in multi-copper enzyme maturation permease subunit